MRAFTLLVVGLCCGSATQAPKADAPDALAKYADLHVPDDEVRATVQKAIKHLLDTQDKDGGWSSAECRVPRRRIPITSLAYLALRAYPTVDKERSAAAQKAALALLLDLTSNKANLKPSMPGAGFDWTYFGMAYTAPLFLDLRRETADEALRATLDERIRTMASLLPAAQQTDGGWAYVQGGSQTFVSAMVIQTLLDVKDAKFEIDEGCLTRALRELRGSRTEAGAYPYRFGTRMRDTAVKGALGRSSQCEMILLRTKTAGITGESLKKDLDDFFQHHDELAKVRKSHSHRPPYQNAGYYFYWGHYYNAQAIAFLAPELQKRYYPALTGLIVKTQDKDGSFFDAPCGGKVAGTSMALLTLSRSHPLKADANPIR